MKLNHLLAPDRKIHSKWTKDLNMRPKTIKILEESIHSNFSGIGRSSFFLDMSPKAQETKAKINCRDFINIKYFHTAKEIINKTQKTAYRMEDDICK